MTIHLNGVPREMPDGSTAEDALRALGRDPAVPGVAVAIGDRVVRRSDWPATVLADGDRVEVITAAQGG
ncbi:MAG: sulfur carrier protein ThiS [Rubricoccaceae bacterium]